MIYPYEDISNIDRSKAIVSAYEIIKNGWARRSYPVVCLDGDIPWAIRSQEERSWNFYIHCWDMLDCLLKAHSENNDVLLINLAIRIACDWAIKYPSDASSVNSPFAWYDMAVGLRSYRLAYIIDAASRDGLIDNEQLDLLWVSLEQHRAFLANDKNIAFHNNHGYYQVAGQLAMGRRFAHRSQLMALAVEQGMERLATMLTQQFTSEGIHREHSPDYHRMVYDTLKAMTDSGLVCNEETIALAEKIEIALSWFVLPNQHIVNFGDSDYRLLLRKVSEANRKWNTAPMRYVVTGGKSGKLSDDFVAAFPEGGFFVVRKPSEDDPENFSKSSYLAQTAAFHSRTHKQADDLSFIWSDRGSDILVDAGRYGYIGKAEQGSDLWLDGHWYSDQNRVYCESTRAHNTLEFDGRNNSRKGVKPYGSALSRWRDDVSGLAVVETECKHFGSVRRARVLVFNPGKWLLVFDWFNDNEKNPHMVKQWFHLAPHLQLHLDNGGYLVSVPSSVQPLRIVSLLAKPVSSRPYIGEEYPVMQGWWSAKERDIVPNYAFCFEQADQESGVFATLFSFSNDLKPDRNWSKVNISGRKGQFRWTDEKGCHVLSLERPAEGGLDLKYACS